MLQVKPIPKKTPTHRTLWDLGALTPPLGRGTATQMVKDPPIDDQARSLELLIAGHTFPGQFVFKVIGDGQADFAQRAQEAIAEAVAPMVAPAPTVRRSAEGNHQALTFNVDVRDAQSVLAIYAALKTVSGVRFIL